MKHGVRLSLIFCSLLWLPPTPAVADPGDCAGLGAEGRSSTGHEDVFVFLDSSLSMGPSSFGSWATGYMEPARRLLLGLVDCYLRDGDFLLVATFDSDARVEIAKELGSERERDTLRLQVEALEPGRARWFRRLEGGRPVDEAMPPRPGTVPEGRILGGAWRTDLGEMLDLAGKVLRDHADPRNRQVVLFFTDGDHDPPEFSRFDDRVTLDGFLSRDDLETRRLQIGIVAVPRTPGDPGAARDFTAMLERLDPDGTRRDAGELAVLSAGPDDGGDPTARFVGQLAGLLRQRVALDAPAVVDLGERVRPEADATFTVRNETGARRRVEIAGASFVTPDGTRYPVEVAPRSLDLDPGGRREVRVTGRLDDLPRGDFDGVIRFDFASAVTFHPHEVRVRGRRLGWWERYGVWLQAAALVTALGMVVGFFWWRRPRWIAAVWTDGDAVHVSRPRPIAVAQSLKFGAPGLATLAVAGPDARLGEVTRSGVHGYELAFDPLFLDLAEGVDGDAAAPRPITAGVWYPVPGRDGQSVAFRLRRSKTALQRLLRQIRTPEPEDSAASSPSGTSDGGGWEF